MYKEWIDTLIISPLFYNVKREKINTMLNCLKPKVERYRKQETVVIPGQSFQGIGIVASGKIALTRETSAGNRIILDIIDKGAIFGEMIAFSDSKRWTMSIIAQEDSCLLFLPPETLVNECDNICKCRNLLISNLLNILSNQALSLSKKIDYLSEKSLRSKLSIYLLDIYQQAGDFALVIPMKRYELADYLNVTRPALSREMSLMRSEGIIDFDGSSIIIKDMAILKKYC